MQTLVPPDYITDFDNFDNLPYSEFIKITLEILNMSVEDLKYMQEVSPYLILDGHRTGMSNSEDDLSLGYIEGAFFSLRFAKIIQMLGVKKATFLIHTLRNYKTQDRMDAIFEAVNSVGKQFIKQAFTSDIRLKYYGSGVHETYTLASIINKAEALTKFCQSFELNFFTNYSEEWAIKNLEKIESLPEISVIGRFTKGHYSGASIPGHTSKANFIYIQQASISKNWSEKDLITLSLLLLKSHLALRGFVGGKSYSKGEKEEIHQAREIQLWEERYNIAEEKPSKRIQSFTPMGPITVIF